MSSNAFKQRARGDRMLVTEEIYSGGMQYSDTPLPDGYLRTLVNFDIGNTGVKLMPRQGYGPSAQGSPNATYNITSSLPKEQVLCIDDLRLEERYDGAVYDDTLRRTTIFGPRNRYTATDLLGDVDGDGLVTREDAYLILSHLAGTITLSSAQLLKADVDGNGLVNEADAQKILAIVEGADPLETSSTTIPVSALTVITDSKAHEEPNVDDLEQPEVYEASEGLYLMTKEAYDVKIHNEPRRVHDLVIDEAVQKPIFAVMNETFYALGAQAKYAEGLFVGTSPRIIAMKLYKDHYTAGDQLHRAEFSVVNPYEPTPHEAGNYGYNMLKENPYAFTDQVTATLDDDLVDMQGIIPYKESTCENVALMARVGQEITFRLVVRVPESMPAGEYWRFKWTLRDLNSDSEITLEDSTKQYRYDYDNSHIAAYSLATPPVLLADDKITLTTAAPYKQFSLVVTAYKASDPTTPIKVMALSSYTLTADEGELKNAEAKEYRLMKAQGACAWKSHMCLWGVPEGRNILFVSDVNNPNYFPYPNNVDVFDSDILNCVQFQDNLLVFTRNKAYKCKWNDDGMSFTQEVIQENLNLTQFDADTVTVVQSMVFFKSDNYYYMFVPSTAASNQTTQTLQLAPISRQINELLDDFSNSVSKIMREVYDPLHDEPAGDYALELTDHRVFVDGNAVVVLYQLNYTGCPMFSFMLRYDTVLRAWTTYVTQLGTPMLPYRRYLTKAASFLTFSNTGNDLKVMLLVRNKDDLVDIAINGDRLSNFQYIDTGYRAHNPHIKKRYRNIEFRVNNLGPAELEFNTEFMIDDEERLGMFNYTTDLVTDENDPLYGWYLVDQEYATPVSTADTLKYNDSLIHAVQKWVLKKYGIVFDTTVSKVRFNVSGKGYCPRFKLRSYNSTTFELLSHGYVYRTQNAR